MTRRRITEEVSQRDFGVIEPRIRFTDIDVRRRLLGISWRLDGDCADREELNWFDAERSLATKRAQRICQGCPLRRLCLAAALSFGEEFGVWGGFTPAQREPMLAAARRGVPVDHIAKVVIRANTESAHVAV